MSETLYGLTAEQVQRLVRLSEMVDGDDPISPWNRRRVQSLSKTFVGRLDAAVQGTTGLATKPRINGNLKVYSFSTAGTTDTGLEVRCYNLAPQSATTDRWTVVSMCGATGVGIIIAQFCS